MPRAWAAIVIRVWSRVASAVRNPLPSAPDHPVGGDGAVVEIQLPGGRSLDAELVLEGTEGEPGVILLDHERGDPARPGRRVGHRHHRVVLRHPGVGDPPLGAVEDKTVPVADRARRHGRRIRARLRLGQARRRTSPRPGRPAAGTAASAPPTRRAAAASCPACSPPGSATTTRTPARPPRSRSPSRSRPRRPLRTPRGYAPPRNRSSPAPRTHPMGTPRTHPPQLPVARSCHPPGCGSPHAAPHAPQ